MNSYFAIYPHIKQYQYDHPVSKPSLIQIVFK